MWQQSQTHAEKGITESSRYGILDLSILGLNVSSKLLPVRRDSLFFIFLLPATSLPDEMIFLEERYRKVNELQS